MPKYNQFDAKSNTEKWQVCNDFQGRFIKEYHTSWGHIFTPIVREVNITVIDDIIHFQLEIKIQQYDIVAAKLLNIQDIKDCAMPYIFWDDISDDVFDWIKEWFPEMPIGQFGVDYIDDDILLIQGKTKYLGTKRFDPNEELCQGA